MKKDRKRRQIEILILFIITLFIVSFFETNIRIYCKKYTVNLVLENKDAFLKLAGRYSEKNKIIMIGLREGVEYPFGHYRKISYKKLGDKEMANTFKKYHLLSIEYDEKQNTVFHIYPYVGLLIKGYRNGFYYNESDVPRKEEECVTFNLEYVKSDMDGAQKLEFVNDNRLYYNWYREEKIMDNWWYYEEIFRLKKSWLTEHK
jgi:hypothetical protein